MWYYEEGDSLPITCVALHAQSKIVGTMRVQFSAALLPTGDETGKKRAREEDTPEEQKEEDEGEEEKGEAGCDRGPSQTPYEHVHYGVEMLAVSWKER